MIGGTGLFCAEGKVWKQHRKFISNVFHFDFLASRIPMMVSTTQEFIGKIAKDRQSWKTIDLMKEIQIISGEIIGRIFFGESLNRY